MNEISTPWTSTTTTTIAERSEIRPMGETLNSLVKDQKETLTDIEGLTNAMLTEVLGGVMSLDEESGRPVDCLAGALEDLRDQAKRVQKKLCTLREKLG